MSEYINKNYKIVDSRCCHKDECNFEHCSKVCAMHPDNETGDAKIEQTDEMRTIVNQMSFEDFLHTMKTVGRETAEMNRNRIVGKMMEIRRTLDTILMMSLEYYTDDAVRDMLATMQMHFTATYSSAVNKVEAMYQEAVDTAEYEEDEEDDEEEFVDIESALFPRYLDEDFEEDDE